MVLIRRQYGADRNFGVFHHVADPQMAERIYGDLITDFGKIANHSESLIEAVLIPGRSVVLCKNITEWLLAFAVLLADSQCLVIELDVPDGRVVHRVGSLVLAKSQLPSPKMHVLDTKRCDFAGTRTGGITEPDYVGKTTVGIGGPGAIFRGGTSSVAPALSPDFPEIRVRMFEKRLVFLFSGQFKF